MYDRVVEGGGGGAAARLRLEGRVCNMPTVMLRLGIRDVRIRARVREVAGRGRVRVRGIRSRLFFLKTFSKLTVTDQLRGDCWRRREGKRHHSQ